MLVEDMYIYLYDKLTKDSQYESLLTSIETRLIELGMNGKIERLAVYKDVDRVLEQYVKKGAHTVVAVGDDTTLRLMVQATWNYNVTLGFIPLKKTPWSEILRTGTGLAACDILSKRLTRKLGVGMAKNIPVLEECSFIATPDVWIRCDDQFTVTFTENSECHIINDIAQHIDDDSESSLRIEITPKKISRFKKKRHISSRFFAQTCMIGTSTHHIPLHIDSHNELQSPCELIFYPKRINMIIGKKL